MYTKSKWSTVNEEEETEEKKLTRCFFFSLFLFMSVWRRQVGMVPAIQRLRAELLKNLHMACFNWEVTAFQLFDGA